MVKVTDFVNICRLCLKDHDDHSVNLFSKQNIEEANSLLVCEMVEAFCNIKVTKDDHLPECICNGCWNVVSSMHTLRMISLKSDQYLNSLLSSHSYSDPAVVKQSETYSVYQIEFIDTQTEQKESLAESEKNVAVDDATPSKCMAQPRKNGIKKKRSGKRQCGEDKISCEMCGKLVTPREIEYHLNAHKDIRPYKCQAEDCEKYFTAPALARHHFRKVHVYSITRPKKCDICGKGFIQQSSLLTHRSYHFDPQIPCTICGQLYRNKRALQRHFLVHSGERKYSCSECKKSFQTSFTLKTHMRIHTLEKPFQCTECKKSFAYKCLLKGHIEKHHPKESG
ncbi:zinc finger protein draculin-like [Bradysia coprophila]|uniref:zinc finger protein draculin-like n=1 Tax=Bradysia coprophila TaxID=38358 RepID=UPI00187D6FD4|nr:zinc finger protein draculin-like [Bradysia coprophila]